MRNLLLTFTIIVFGVCDLLALSSPIQGIQKRGNIKVAMYSGQAAPFLMLKNRELIGFDVDLARLIAKDLGVKLEILPSAKTFDEVVAMVKRGEADIGLSNLSITSKRAKQVIFTDPYLKLKIGVVFNRMNMLKVNGGTDEGFNHPKMTAGVLKGSAMAGYINNRYPKAKLKYFEDNDSVYKALAAGKVDFTMADQSVIDGWRYKFPSLNLKTNVKMLAGVTDPLGVAVAWNNNMLARWLNVFFIGLENSGQLNSMKQKYFANDLWRVK
jgi:ABC-type amino acid transport substrate-binding protein